MRLRAIPHYIKRIGKHTNTPQDTSCTRLSSIRFFLIIIIIIIVVVVVIIIVHISFPDFFPSFLLLCVQRSRLNTVFIGLEAHHLTRFYYTNQTTILPLPHPL